MCYPGYSVAWPRHEKDQGSFDGHPAHRHLASVSEVPYGRCSA